MIFPSAWPPQAHAARKEQEMFHAQLQNTVQILVSKIDEIPAERKKRLAPLVDYVRQRAATFQPVRLNFICTHNSRRSHLGQLWAATAATYYGISGVETFSGGTEATAFNPRAVAAIERDGFVVTNPGGTNPRYSISQGPGLPELLCFSKTFDDALNPTGDFAAVMTCTDADQNCPAIMGATRISLPYVDPKEADDTEAEASRYTERSHQIGTELLSVFAAIRL